MKRANRLRLVCREFREAVTEFPWNDILTRIKGSVRVWRAVFPYARSANVSGRDDIVDADLCIFVAMRAHGCIRWIWSRARMSQTLPLCICVEVGFTHSICGGVTRKLSRTLPLNIGVAFVDSI